MTPCNMIIEAGSRPAMVAPDATTFAYVEGRRFAPRAAAWQRAMEYWQTLFSDPDAHFDRTLAINAAELAPFVTWGTNPGMVLPVTGRIPDPNAAPSAEKRAASQRALDYMGLEAGI